MDAFEKDGTRVRGFRVHVFSKGKDKAVSYPPTGHPFYTLAQAADVCRTAMARKCKVVAETESKYTGTEWSDGERLIELADWRHPDDDDPSEAKAAAQALRIAEVAELAARRLYAPDLMHDPAMTLFAC